MGERLGHLRREMERFLPVEEPLAVDILLEGDALDELHDDIFDSAGTAHVVDGDNVRMRKHRDRLRFRVEPAPEIRVLGKVVLKYLDGDEPVEPVTARLVDDRHAADPDPLQNLVPIVEILPDILIGVVHLVSSCPKVDLHPSFALS